MNKLLVLAVLSISLIGCISSRYHEGVTEIGIPEPLPTEKHTSHTDTRSSIEEETYATWLTGCQAKLGTEIARGVRATIKFRSFDLQHGWDIPASKPYFVWNVWDSPRLDPETNFLQKRFAHRLYLNSTMDSAVYIDAIVGRFILSNASDTTLEYLSNIVDDVNGAWSSPITMRKTSENVWESSRVNISLMRHSISFSPFGVQRPDVTDKRSEALTFSDLAASPIEQAIPESLTIVASLMDAHGTIRFEPTAVTLSDTGGDVGCLTINNQLTIND